MGIQFIQVLDAQPIGSVVCTLSDAGSPTYTLVSNPGNLFALSGNQISINAVLSIGQPSIIVSDGANDLTIQFDVTAVAPFYTPGERPFSPTSPANIPIAAGTNYQQLNWPVATGFNYFTGVKFYMDIPAPTEPVCSFDIPASWGWPDRPSNFVMTSNFNGVEALLSNSDGDNEAMPLQNTTLYSLYNFTRTGDTSATCSSGAQCDILSDTGFGSPTGGTGGGGAGAGAVATGSSYMLGALLKEEWTATGAFNHWISFSAIASLCNNQSPNYYAPAINGDGSSGNGLFCEGQLMAIPPGVSMPAGLTIYGAALFNAAQTYGFWCNDTGGAFTTYCARIFEDTGSSPWCSANSWSSSDVSLLASDLNILMPMLYKTGFVLDGYLFTGQVQSAWNPQIQLLRYLGSILQITRDSDNSSENIGSIGPPSGNLNTSSITSFCSGTVGRMTEYFDQIGNGRILVSSGSAAPIMYESGALVTMNGQPAMLFDGSSNYLTVTNSATVAGRIYFNIAFQLTDLSSDYTLFGYAVASTFGIKVQATTGIVEIISGGSVVGQSSIGVTAGVPFLVSVTLGTGSWTISFNSFAVTSGSTTVALPQTGNILVGSLGPGAANLFKGIIGSASLGGLPASLSQFTIEKYLAAFWGATTHNFLIVQDTFTDTNGTLLPAHTMNIGAGWTDVTGTFQIASNTAQPGTLVSGKALAITPAASDGHIQCTLTPINQGSGNVSWPGIAFRYADSGDYLLFQIQPNNNIAWLYRIQGGGQANLANFIGAFSSGTGYLVDIVLNGPSIKISINGTLVISISNSYQQSSSTIGLLAANSGSPTAQCSFDTLTFHTA